MVFLEEAVMSDLVLLIRAAGVLLWVIAAANLFVPAKLDYAQNLARLSPIVRQVFVIHSLFVVLVVIGSGALCLFLAPRLIAADPLSVAVSSFLSLFWSLRFILQVRYLDKDFARGHLLAHISYSLACAFLAVIFMAATWQGLA